MTCVHRLLAVCSLVLAATATPTVAHAQTLNGPLSLVVGYAAGGSTDRAARIVAERLTTRLGVPVTVDNRAGDGGRLAAQQLSHAPADQNVLMLANPAVMVVAPIVFKSAGYDPDKDFVPISQVTSYDFAVAVGPAVPLDRLMFLVGWLWGHPQDTHFGVPATGSLPHFFGLMVGDALNIKPQIIGYKGSAPLQADLVAGKVPIAIDTLDSLLPPHVAGKVRILAVSGTHRADFAKDIPTFREAGLQIDAAGWNTFFAPSSMPAAKQHLIAQAIHDVMQEPAVQHAFTALYLNPVVSTQAESAKMIKAFREQWEPVVRRAGFAP
ncbi:MAG TPA: tripartite tricarboxylate transporter substrate-binding protein [Burkholderiaceae bacterium]|nr:tripartite tricarboxylate transporter substrate-binding protein [Burkholderiaceae bacterium]